MNTSPPALAQAIQLRNEKRHDEALKLLQSLLASSPTDPLVNYHCAWTCDSAGKEGEAVPYYEAALKYGLSGEDRCSAYLGLGSTYRCLGKYEQSLKVLEDGITEFPEYRALQTFRALTLYNLGKHSDSVGSLLTQLLETTTDPSIKSYSRALAFYSDKLDQTWE